MFSKVIMSKKFIFMMFVVALVVTFCSIVLLSKEEYSVNAQIYDTSISNMNKRVIGRNTAIIKEVKKVENKDKSTVTS